MARTSSGVSCAAFAVKLSKALQAMAAKDVWVKEGTLIVIIFIVLISCSAKDHGSWGVPIDCAPRTQ
jgi:hypothetical protein